MGHALGCIGMRLDDFCRLTPTEFAAVCKAHTDESEAFRKERWEMVRLQSTLAMQPYSKKRLDPREVIPFPWDDEGKPKMSKEEQLARMEQLRKQFEGKP